MEEKTNFLEKFWYIFVIIALALIVIVTTLWVNNQKALKQAEMKSTQTIQQPTNISQTTPTPTVIEDEITAKLATQSGSDEISDIEKDLNETDFSSLDKEMTNIEAEISKPE